jgi:hypothetical protein
MSKLVQDMEHVKTYLADLLILRYDKPQRPAIQDRDGSSKTFNCWYESEYV